MKEVYDFLKNAGVYFLATADGNQPFTILRMQLPSSARLRISQLLLNSIPELPVIVSASDYNSSATLYAVKTFIRVNYLIT